jgi:hypothetical protein
MKRHTKTKHRTAIAAELHELGNEAFQELRPQFPKAAMMLGALGNVVPGIVEHTGLARPFFGRKRRAR